MTNSGREYLREQAEWAANAVGELTLDEREDAMAEIDAEVRGLLEEATMDGNAHGVTTLLPLLAGYSSATIEMSLRRLESDGKARRDDSGFDHLDDGELGWWHVITGAESAATDEEIRRQIDEENDEFGPYYDADGAYIDGKEG